MKKSVSILLFVLMCSFVNAGSRDSCVYTNGCRTIIFYSDNNFVEMLELDIFPLDTISYGKYVKYSNVLYLTSDPSIDDNILTCFADEQISQTLFDSVIIDINSPMALLWKANKSWQPFFYQITLYYDITNEPCDSKEIINVKTGESSPQFSFTLPLRISKLPNIPIKLIEIKIYPTYPDTWWAYLFCSFTLQNGYSNQIQLTIPQFKKQYLSYIRYDQKKILILDNECILKDNDIYCRKFSIYNSLFTKYKKKIPKAFMWWKVKNPYD